MRHDLIAFALAAAALVAGCANQPPSPFGKDGLAKLRIDNVSVSVAPDANISWSNAEMDYVHSKQADPGYRPKQHVVETGSIGPAGSGQDSEYASIASTPDAKEHVRKRAAERLKQALDGNVKAFVQQGAQPVRLEVTIKSFIVPSAAQRVIVGGTPIMMATAELKDAKTGAVLASRPDLIIGAFAGNGWAGVLADQAFEDLDVRLTQNYAVAYLDWLQGKDAT